MFKKFGQELPQSLVDVVSNIMEDKYEPAKPDADAVARKKKLDALRDKREADAAEKGYEKEKPTVRKIAGKAYGGAKQKDEPEQQDEAVRVKDTSGDYNLSKGAGKSSDSDRKDAASIVKHHRNISRATGTSAKKFMQGSKLKKSTGFEVTKEDIEPIEEKAVSKAQQKFMGMVYKAKKGGKAASPEVAKAAAGMSKKSARDFAKTKHKGLPQHKEEVELGEELVLDLREDKEGMDIPFTPDKPHGPIAVAGKKGYGVSAAHHLARQGLKKILDAQKKTKQETVMGKAGCTSEETVEESVGDAQYHKSVTNGVFKQYNGKSYLHDKDSKAYGPGDKLINKPRIATFEKEKHADQAAKQHGGKVEKTAFGSFRVFKEETVEERVITPGTGTSSDPLVARTGISRDLKKGDERAKSSLKTAIKSTVKNKEHGKSNLPEETVDESRGHKIIATKLRQIDTMSSGIAPDHNTNNQSTRDKLKDASNVGKVEIVNQKDTTIKGADHTEDELETKRKLNQYSHGYGNVVHKEEVEQVDEISTPTLKNYRYKAIDKVIKHNRAAKIAAYDQEYDDAERHDKEAAKRQKGVNAASKRLAARGEIPSVKKEELQIDETATLDKYIKSMGYDPLNMDKNKKVMFSKTNAFKSWAQRHEALYDGGQKGTQDIDTHMSPGATARG